MAEKQIPSKSSRVLIITDNKPGHRNQLEGLAQQIQQLVSVQTDWLVCTSLLKTIKTLWHSRKTPTALAIAAGHKTHIALLVAGWLLKARTMVLMKPSLPMRWFDLCLVPRHDQVAAADNVIKTLGVLNRVQPVAELDSNQGLLLIGGQSKHYDWNNQAIIAQLESVMRQYSCHWSIATSRRTPASFQASFSRVFPHLNLITPDQVGPNWLPQQFQQAGIVWVSEDSVSMVFEALTAGGRVGLLRLMPRKQTHVVAEMQRLIDEERVTTTEIADPINQHDQLWEAQRCAQIVCQRFLT